MMPKPQPAQVRSCRLGWLLALGVAATNAVHAAQFEFAALGDMPYGPPEVDFPRYEALLDALNASPSRFVFHVGDIKSGRSACTDSALLAQRALE